MTVLKLFGGGRLVISAVEIMISIYIPAARLGNLCHKLRNRHEHSSIPTSKRHAMST